MKKPLAHTKVTVKLRKSQYKEEWYLIVEAYPVVKAGNKVERIVESVNRIITTPIWDKSSSTRSSGYKPNYSRGSSRKNDKRWTDQTNRCVERISIH